MSITKIDANGRVLLPIGIRYQLDLNDGDELAVDELGDGTIILKKIDCRLRFKKWLNGAGEQIGFDKNFSSNEESGSPD
jgi:AbrB family looped-hinge helix DNA binding protein